MRPRLVDLYCCEGGASRGYDLAGWDVHGVDLFREYSQGRYPYESTKADALHYLAEHWYEYDAAHASPPCQRHTAGTRARDRGQYPDLIGPTRALLNLTGLPYVIENVPGAPLHSPVTLCGSMFGIVATDTNGETVRLERHRLFETNWPLMAPGPCDHDRGIRVAGSYGGARNDPDEARNVRHGGYVPPWSSGVQQALMGIDWMTQKGCHQAIPPVYATYVGTQLLDHVRQGAA